MLSFVATTPFHTNTGGRQRLFRCPATIEDKGRTGHEARSVRGQEDDSSTDLFRLPPAFQCDMVHEKLVCLRVVDNRGIQFFSPARSNTTITAFACPRNVLWLLEGP